MKRIFVLFSLTVIFSAASIVSAQSNSVANIDDHKSEIGFFYTGIDMKGFGETINGLGGRFSYNLNKNIAIDSEFGFLPRTHLGNSQSGQKTQTFIGVKAGVRSGRIGIFAKARPGAMFIGEVTTGLSCSSVPTGQICHPRHSNLAFDLGGVVELYPTSRSIVRFDAGDTIVRIRSTTPGLLTPSVNQNSTTNNFQFSVGFGYRF